MSLSLGPGARQADGNSQLLDIYGDEWRTPLRDFAPRQTRRARLVVKDQRRGYYPMEGTGGFEFLRVRRAPLPVVVLERRDSAGSHALRGTAVGGGWAEWMVDDPLHWYAMGELVERLQPGRLLVAGLGLGIQLRHLIHRDDISQIDVIEIDPDVIELISPTLPGDDRVTIHEGDYYDWIEQLARDKLADLPSAILWDLAVGTRDETRDQLAIAAALTGYHLPGVPLHRFGLRGPDPLGLQR